MTGFIKLSIFSTLLLFSVSCSSQSNRPFLEKQLSNSPKNEGPEPEYSQTEYWAALPSKPNLSQQVPKGSNEASVPKKVDAFYIHPTTYINAGGNQLSGEELKKHPFKALKALKSSPWNADITDASINNKTDSIALLYQATAFNESCDIYAPYYRQANLKAFLVKGSLDAQKAFDLAYSDIKKAFEYYLKHYNNGRPIVIVSHSQGAMLAIMLLKDYFDGKPLQSQLVCAYVVGQPIPKNTFSGLPFGTTPDQTHCVVGWQSFNADAGISEKYMETRGNSLGINPITWTTGTGFSPVSEHKGAMMKFGKIETRQISCQLTNDGLLLVKLPSTWAGEIKSGDNLHFYDYQLFWSDIRENIKVRIAAFNKDR